MKMSMSGKIYSIIILLFIVALVILGVGVYAMRNLSTSIGFLGRTANRNASLNSIETITLQRRIATVSIIDTLDESAMRSIMDKDFKQLEQDFTAQMADFEAQCDTPPTPRQTEIATTLRKIWNEYVEVTNQIATLSLENSNYRASVLFQNSLPFWNEIDGNLRDLAEFVNANNAEAVSEKYSTLVQETRVKLMLFRALTLQFIPETEPARIQELENAILAQMKDVDTGMAEIVSGLEPELGGAMAKQVADKLTSTGTGIFVQTMELVRKNSNRRANELMHTTGLEVRLRLVDFIDGAIHDSNVVTENAITYASTLAATMTTLMIAIGAVGIVVAMILAYVTVSRIIRQLRGVITALDGSSQQVSQAASHISSSSQQLAEGSTEQAASLEETSSALEEMASMTRQNADNAVKTNETTAQNGKRIESGSVAVGNMAEAMGEISESAEQINRIIKTIEDIAFQTNLLALNAAVEAARAGEAGKGFAVVADEVRNLAGRSAQAARDTTQLIETTISRVRHGSSIAEELITSFKEIEEGSNTVARLISEITAATNEQAQGVDQVNTAVAQMDKVTQSNAATAEESASAAEQLSGQAESLSGMVEQLVGMVEGSTTGTRSLSGTRQPRAALPRPAPKMLGDSSSRGGNADHSAPARAATVKTVRSDDIIPLDAGDDF
ncbi:MAG: methyl-accepting chemotaxis protein [Planctomycetes bacterium]|nr:methyl-accepting chemotaxis protein [Planctomycetota bacterium]